jgi:hypothetical protein
MFGAVGIRLLAAIGFQSHDNRKLARSGPRFAVQ